MNKLNAPRIHTGMSVLSRKASVTKPVHCVLHVWHYSDGERPKWICLHIAVQWPLSAASARGGDENDAFWIGEAEEWDKLISEYATLQPQIRTGQTAPGKSASANDRDDAKLSNILLTQMTLGDGRRVLHPWRRMEDMP
jgi:hypothetical protein